MKTTLKQLREFSPCAEGWTQALRTLGKTQADDEPLAISTVVEMNGVDDALWCLRAIGGFESELRLYAVECARMVQHLLLDQRSRDALEVAHKYALGQATLEDLQAASRAAFDTASEAWQALAGEDAQAAAIDVALVTKPDVWEAVTVGSRGSAEIKEARANKFKALCLQLEARA